MKVEKDGVRIEMTADEFAAISKQLNGYHSPSGEVTGNVIRALIDAISERTVITDAPKKTVVATRPVICGIAPAQLAPMPKANFGHKGVGVAMLNDLGMEERRFKSKVDAVRHLQANGIIVSDKAIGKAIAKHEQIGGFYFRYTNN